jgi:hypothetical protein
MKTVAVANTWDEAAAILEAVGPLVTLHVAAAGLGVGYTRVYALCAEGKLRCYSICGVYHTPYLDVAFRRLRIAHCRSGLDSGHTAFAA